LLQDDPQDRSALRQGGIALIHSAPTGDRTVNFDAVIPTTRSGDPESLDPASMLRIAPE
jgi:hypothetical protein